MSAENRPLWEDRLHELLPLYGHRNWIVVADSAYPAQASPGIETILARGDPIEIVRMVMRAITATGHVRAGVFLDYELPFVHESDAPGIDNYRRELDATLRGASLEELPHEQIIARLDQSAEVFRVLIVKTEMTLPYTSVFFALDCGYWSAEAEGKLRQAIAAAGRITGEPD